jgi:hypothetical protein
VEGTLAEGTITAPDPGNACGWVDLAAVLAAMESGPYGLVAYLLTPAPTGEAVVGW